MSRRRRSRRRPPGRSLDLRQAREEPRARRRCRTAGAPAWPSRAGRARRARRSPARSDRDRRRHCRARADPHHAEQAERISCTYASPPATTPPAAHANAPARPPSSGRQALERRPGQLRSHQQEPRRAGIPSPSRRRTARRRRRQSPGLSSAPRRTDRQTPRGPRSTRRPAHRRDVDVIDRAEVLEEGLEARHSRPRCGQQRRMLASKERRVRSSSDAGQHRNGGQQDQPAAEIGDAEEALDHPAEPGQSSNNDAPRNTHATTRVRGAADRPRACCRASSAARCV